jgi:hypothetical protein
VAAGAGLASSTRFKAYQSEKFFYTLMHPADWEVEIVDQAGSEVLLSGGGPEFMEVLVVGNPDKISAAAWYARQFPSLSPAEVPELKAGELTWALASDGLTAYLATENSILTLSYNIGTSEQASYLHLFNAMIRLFALAPSEQPIPVPTPITPSQDEEDMQEAAEISAQ